MSQMKRVLISAAALLLVASVALAGPLPVWVLGPNNPVDLRITNTNLYPVHMSSVIGGGFTGEVRKVTQTETKTAISTFWCVDSQRYTTSNYVKASIIGLWNDVTQSPYAPEVRSASLSESSSPVKWMYSLGIDSATIRYRMAAWLIEQYTGFPNGPNAGGVWSDTSSNALKNRAIQAAIWRILMDSTGSWDTVWDNYAWDTWITNAYNAVVKQKWQGFRNWGVVSWGVNPQGDLSGTAYQTFLVQVVPEPGFYGLLGLGLSALIFFARRRQSATS